MQGVLKKLISLLFILILLILPVNNVKAEIYNYGYSLSIGKNAIVSVQVDSTYNKGFIVEVLKDNIKYQHIAYKKTDIKFPLTEGKGAYIIKIYNILNYKDGTYTVSLKSEDNYENKYSHNYLINYYQVNWTENSKVIIKAADLTKGLTTDVEKAKAIHNYIVKNYTYDFDKPNNIKSNYIPNSSQVYKDKSGVCYDFSVLYAAMARSVGIKTKLVKGYTEGSDVYHAWNQFYDSDAKKWFTVDCTYDIALYGANQKYTLKKSYKDYNNIKFKY